MLDSYLRPLIDPPLNAVARLCVRVGVGADAVTAAGLTTGLACFAALALHFYTLALALMLMGRLCDGLDGAVARQSAAGSGAGATDRGAFLDIVCDFFFYGGFVFFFTLGRPEDAIAAAFLLFSFLCSGTSFLAYAVMAEKRGIKDGGRQGKKSFVYLSGLAEGFETIAVFAAMCIFPDYFDEIAWAFGALCLVSAAGRVFRGMKDF